MKYDQLIIFYFSGTGNARNAAFWINQVGVDNGLKTHLINIDNFEKIELPKVNNRTLIGFCSPTHGFNLPPIMLKLIWKFPKLGKIDVFILNTRGGLKLSSLFIPGASGAAQILPALMLRFKGFRIVGMQPLDLPSNWLILHPGLRQQVIDSIYSRCNRIVNDFASKLLKGKKRFKALLSLPIDIALLPISVGYYFFGRFFLAKTLMATDACNNCEKCEKECPVKAIKMIDARPYWSYRCESCMRCVNACPQRAIETTHAFSISLLILSSLVISPLLVAGLKYSGVLEFFNQSVITKRAWSLIDAFIFLMFVFLSYRLMHYLMRYKFVNKLIAYTSLSKFRFWRRYKAPKPATSQKI